MIKPEYKRELSHSYLILENIPKDKMDNYQCRMILKNKIPGLLCSSERYINGKVCLYYDISSRQSLDQLYEAGKMSFAEILGIVDGLAHVLENMSGFLLEEQIFCWIPGICIWIWIHSSCASFIIPLRRRKIRPAAFICR